MLSGALAGAPVTINVEPTHSGGRPVDMMRLERAADAGAGFRPGTIVVERRVHAVFEFEPSQ